MLATIEELMLMHTFCLMSKHCISENVAPQQRTHRHILYGNRHLWIAAIVIHNALQKHLIRYDDHAEGKQWFPW